MRPSGAVLASLLVAISAVAQRSPVRFRVTPIDGDELEFYSLLIDTNGSVPTPGTDRKLQLADLSEIVRLDGAKPGPATDWAAIVRLRSGTEIGGESIAGNPAGIEIRPFGSPTPVAFALRHVAALRFARPVDDDGGFARTLDKPATTSDLVFAWDREGEAVRRYSMRVERIEGSDLVVDASGQSRRLPLSRVHGVVFGTDTGSAPDPLPKPIVTLRGRFGSALTGRLVEMDAERCRIALAEGPVFGVPCSSIDRITVDSGRVAFLTQLEPTNIEQVPALDRIKPWLRDRTPIGDGVELGGRTYRHGLCLVPRAALRYDVSRGDWRVFEATVGIDNRSQHMANAVIRVRADERVVFDSGPITVGDAPKKVSVDLTGVSSLTLETDFGDNLDLGDHCVFADARLRKE